MNILVVGNGFDLAHGLPTKYTDFLYFCNAVKEIIKSSKLNDIIPKKDDYVDWINSNNEIKFLSQELYDITYRFFIVNLRSKISKRDEKVYKEIFENFIKKYFWKGNTNQKWIKEILYLISNNVWIEYFLECDMHGEENWIDFENEISKVIEAISSTMEEYNITLYEEERNFGDGNTYHLKPEYDKILNKIKKCKRRNEKITYLEIRNYLLMDLEKLIRALEIYLCDYVEKKEVIKKSPDIEALKIDHVLSFNYTDTFSKLYKIEKRTGDTDTDIFDYIHGKADINNTIELNNIVLGIDEYLPDDRKDKDLDFIAFKKFYQRIFKGTGCKYKEWIHEIREDYAEYHDRLSKSKKGCPKHSLYIFGHSLDITDKDILCDLILNDNVHTTIFYHKEYDEGGNHDNGRQELGKKIANLVKVIGQDELIKRTGGSTKTIDFVPQQEMMEISPIERD